MNNMNQVQESVYRLLANRQRVNTKTDVTQFTKYVKSLLSGATENDVLEVFKGFEKQGYGSLIIGRKNNPNRFLWSFNLKEVAKKALGEPVSEMINIPEAPKVYKKRGPKPKTKSAAKVTKTPRKVNKKSNKLVINLELGANVRPEDLQALISLANSLKG